MAKYKQLTGKKKEQIVALFQTGAYTKRGLARQFNCTDTTVGRVLKGIDATLASTVELGVQYETQKSCKTVAQKQAIQEVVKTKTKEERLKEVIQISNLQGTAANVTNAVKQAQDKDTVPTDRNNLQRVFKTAQDLITPKEEKAIQQSINIAQLMSEREDEKIIVPTSISEMNAEELVQALKNRNLPEAQSNEEKLKEMGLI